MAESNLPDVLKLLGESKPKAEKIDICYLDHAGATLYSEIQIKNIFENLAENIYGNPHSLNHGSKLSSDLVDRVRSRILKHFHTTSDEYTLIFTSGATAAIKLLLENFDWEANDESEEFFDSESSFFDRSEFPCGAYIYTRANHTSIVGGREIAKEKNIPFYCLEQEQTNRLMKTCNGPRQMHPSSNSLFAYPAQCNFSGRKYPLEWVRNVQNGALDSYGIDGGGRRNSRWFCLLDAATFCSTNDLNLSQIRPDFVCLSFYKIFGYPTGLGALLVCNSSAFILNKKYFGGGTVDISLSGQDFHRKRKSLHERLEDGTVSYLSILSLDHGLNTFSRLNLNMKLISRHVFQLAKYSVEQLKSLTHWNGAKVVEIYADSDYSDITTQGGIVNFNLRRADSQYIGFMEVLHLANLRKIYLRTGCFCNSGACQRHLHLSDADLKLYYQAGHVCGDSKDLIDGKPTGSVRVSYGYMTTQQDVDRLTDMIRECFVEVTPRIIPEEKFLKSGGLKLSKISTFPIKSCGAMYVDSWRLNEKGLEYDREWMVVTESGICLTQKQEPRMCLIVPIIDVKNQTMTLSFRNEHDQITIPIENKTVRREFDLCESKVCKDIIRAHDCGDAAADWLCRHLNGKGLRLVRQAKDDGRRARRTQNQEREAKLSLSNQAQYLLINEGSVRWLQKTIILDEDVNEVGFGDRFRGNFYVDGGQEFAENSWSRLRIGQAQFKVEGPCGRCQMICVDQLTGKKSRKPLVELSRALNGKLHFGIYLSHDQNEGSAVVSVGDFVAVEEEK